MMFLYISNDSISWQSYTILGTCRSGSFIKKLSTHSTITGWKLVKTYFFSFSSFYYFSFIDYSYIFNYIDISSFIFSFNLIWIFYFHYIFLLFIDLFHIKTIFYYLFMSNFFSFFVNLNNHHYICFNFYNLTIKNSHVPPLKSI